MTPASGGKWILSVGATPTAHAATQIEQGEMDLEGVLELYVTFQPLSSHHSICPSGPDMLRMTANKSHAGCYCMLDIQQLATSLISHSDLAISILSRVVSKYDLRDEAMCDAGALAVSKDTGPLPGYGHVVWPERLNGWDLGRISQEHGTLVRRAGTSGGQVKKGEVGKEEMEIGDLIRIVPQHACLACASYPWFYVVEDGGEKVVDIWVPCKGW
jgi:D-serine deaminase-like pyridoxal phosphate-dependent protein